MRLSLLPVVTTVGMLCQSLRCGTCSKVHGADGGDLVETNGVSHCAGPEAAAIVEEAGLPPKQSLLQLWAEGRHVLPSGPHSVIKLLGVQSQLVGSQHVASVLHMHTAPSCILPPEQVRLVLLNRRSLSIQNGRNSWLLTAV